MWQDSRLGLNTASETVLDRGHSTEVIYSSSHRDYDFLDERRWQMEAGEAWPDQRWFRKDQSKLFWWAWSIFSLSLSDSSVTTSEQVCISSAKDRNFHSDGEWLICLERRTGVKMLPSRHFVRLFCWLIGPSSKRSTFTSPTWNVLNILIYDSNLELIWNHRSESDWDSRSSGGLKNRAQVNLPASVPRQEGSLMGT